MSSFARKMRREHATAEVARHESLPVKFSEYDEDYESFAHEKTSVRMFVLGVA